MLDVKVFTTLSVKDNDDMKVTFVFKRKDQNPFSKKKNHLDLKWALWLQNGFWSVLERKQDFYFIIIFDL